MRIIIDLINKEKKMPLGMTTTNLNIHRRHVGNCMENHRMMEGHKSGGKVAKRTKKRPSFPN